MNDIESTNKLSVDKYDTLADLVSKKFWINRNKFKETNHERLVKMSKVEWKNEKYTGTLDQNERIRKRILQGDIISLHSYPEVINKFSIEQKRSIISAFPNGEVDTYMSNFTQEQISKFKKLSPIQLVAFLRWEIQNVQKEKIQYKNNETPEQILNLNQLIDVEERIDRFVNSNEYLSEWIINTKTRTFKGEDKQKGYMVYAQKAKWAPSYGTLLKLYGEEKAEDILINNYRLEQLASPEIQSKMNSEAKAEFNALVIEYYEVNQKLGIDMWSSGLQIVYENAKQSMTERYEKNDAYSKMIENINMDSDIASYFEKNKNTEWIPQWMKDKAYYKKLLVRYPSLDTKEMGKKISEYMEYLNDDMTIKNDTPDEQKKTITSLLPKLKEQGKPYEEKLVNKTNALIQDTAISQCITTLQKYMDVNISEKDNVIQQLKIDENRDAVSPDMMFHINGTLNGKKIALSYNLLTGNVTYKSFLNKKTISDQSPITLGSWDEEDQIPLITLPRFGDFIEAAKPENMEYHKLLTEAETIDDYARNFTENLQNKVQKSSDMDIQKDMLKKYIIKDIITHDIFSLTGKNIDRATSGYMITPNAQPQSHAFYNFIYKSLEYYSMGSINQLQWFQKNINTLLKYREEPKSISSLLSYKENNQEMFAIQSITNPGIIPNNVNESTNQWPEEQLAAFFKCFEKQTGGIAIIDVEMMNDYFNAAAGTNKEDNNVGKWKRNQSFMTMVNGLDSKISGDQATKNLEQQLNS